MKQPLVSVIIPCYNMADKMIRFMESLLQQSYTNLELLFVDDGSLDSTAAIIQSYAQRYRDCGMQFHYLYQTNQGLGSAISHGLQEATGDYFVWPDSDDWLSPDSVEKKVSFLQTHPEYDCVTSNGYLYHESDLEHPIGTIVPERRSNHKEDQFELMLRSKSVFCSGCHMIRMRAFLEANPERYIYPARRGQNWQILLPIFYHRKRYFLDEPLYHYVVYKDSMSRGDNTLEACIFRQDGITDILNNTLAHIRMTEKEREKYQRIVRIEDSNVRLYDAFRFHNKDLFDKMYAALRKEAALNPKTCLFALRMNSDKFNRLILSLKKILR